MIPRVLLLPALLLLSACQSKQPDTAAAPAVQADDPKAASMHKAGLVLIPDLEHASAWEKLIHVEMGVPSSKIEVQAGPGYTTLTIRELKNRGDAEGIAQGLRQYAERNPAKYGPTEVEIKLNDAAPTITPFVLPTEMGGSQPPNPGSVLPTLSLPPLLPAAR